MTINKELVIAKYNMHVNEIKATRDSVFYTMQLLVVLWGAYLTLITTYSNFLNNNSSFSYAVIMGGFFLFTYIALYLGRIIRIEKIHWAIIRLFEKDFPVKFQFHSYIDESPIRNKNIILGVSAISPILSLLIAGSIVNLRFLGFDNLLNASLTITLILISLNNFIYIISSIKFKPQIKKSTHKSK